tara:strand:+ start:40 stop:522 length:483 start_codon:yes stop_codon:yes gene_type:complete
MKNIISDEGTISGKTALFRYFLLFIIYALLLYIVMPNDFLDIESKEVYNMRYFFKEDRYLDLLKYSIVTIAFWYLIILTIIKRLSAFESSKNSRVKSFWLKFNAKIGPAIGFPILYSEFKILSNGQLLVLTYLFLFAFFISGIIPSLINSPVTDYKDHKG